jgi:hypothetical protein
MRLGLPILGPGRSSALSLDLQRLASYGASDAWDFVADQYIRAGVASPSGLTVTRASSGYAETSDGRLVEFGANVLRRTDKGVLVEGSRTNLALWSRDFTNAAWVKVNVTAALDQVGVDGTANGASSLTATAGLGTALQTVISGSAARAATCYVKRITGSGTIEFTSDGISYTDITSSLSTGSWFRALVTGTITNPVIGFRITTSGDAIAVDFAGLESAVFPSSPIVTTTASATRAADQVTASLSGVAYPASLYSEFVRNGDTGGFEEILAVRNSTNNYVDLYIGSGDLATASMWSGGVNQGTSPVAGSVSVGALQKVAARYDTNSIRACRNGTLANEDTSATLPAASPNIVDFGVFVTGTHIFGYLCSSAIIPAALTNAQLQGITS